MTNSAFHLLYLSGHTLTALLTAGIGYWIMFRTEMPARRLFGVAAAFATLWSVTDIATLLLTEQSIQIWLRVLWTLFSVIGAFLLFTCIAEYTGRNWRETRAVQLLAVILAVLIPIILTAPIHGLYWSTAAAVSTPFPHLQTGVGPLRPLGIGFTLVCLAGAIHYLVELSLKSRHRPSRALLVIGLGISIGCIPFFLSAQGILLVDTYNHSSFGASVIAVAIGYAAFELDLTNTVPIARDTAVDLLTDPFFVVNDEGILIDFNPAASDLFGGLSEDRTGEPLDAIAPAIASQLLSVSADEPSEITVEQHGTTRYFDVTASTVYGPHGTSRGREILLRDITKRRQHQEAIQAREQELEMLKQVFSRVLRHNVRNELTVVQGQIRLIDQQIDEADVHDRIDTALESTDRLLSHTKKARQIEDIVASDTKLVAQSLSDVVTAAVESVQREWDGLRLETNLDSVQIIAAKEFQLALENALENAVEHNPTPVDVTIASELRQDEVVITVSDNGTGIPTNETEILSEEEETALSHGSGVGLWVMKWYTEKSDGTLDITGTDAGTQVQMTLPRVERFSETGTETA